LADYSFPFGQALELLLACFKGSLSAKINSLQQQLQKTDILSQPDNPKQIQKLNNLESQAWLYGGILERLTYASVVNHEKIARTIEALESKRNEILQELEPRKPQRYRILEKIQDSARYLLASQAEKDYERLERIVTNLIIFTRTRQPSEIILAEVIERLSSEIAQNANEISPYRLRLAYKIDDLIKLISEKLILSPDSSITDHTYQKLVEELRSRITLLSKQFNGLLKTKQQNTEELNKRIKDISNLTKHISDLHKIISDKEEDISVLRKNTQDLTELVKIKQADIDNLQKSISDLQRDIQSSTEIDQKKQAQIDHLQNQVLQLNQQKLELQKKNRQISDYARNKESEVANLQNQKAQLSSQKADLQRQYQTLYQNYQHQQTEIESLKKQIKNLSQINRSQASTSSYKPPQQPIQETRPKISIEEYQQIINKSDYVRVKAHYRNGSYVKAHYRRKPNR
jgi:myosin heavy subunit